MQNFVTVGQVSDFPPESKRDRVVDGVPVAVINLEGKLYCVSNICPHLGLKMIGAIFRDDYVVCVNHYMSFNVATGEGGIGTDESIPTYKVRIQDDDVQVSLA